MSGLKEGGVPVIAGSGRSGTTWVLDVLAKSNGYATAFEPLHPQAVPEVADYAGRFFGKGDRCAFLEEFLNRVFAGDVRNIWIQYRVRPDRLSPSSSVLLHPRKAYEWLRRWRKLFRHYKIYKNGAGRPILTKFIRANLMLPWMKEIFNARIVYVVRHPGAVIESKMRLGGDDWDPDTMIARYSEQTPIANQMRQKLSGVHAEKLSVAGKHALIWCVENAQILNAWRQDNIYRVYYEDLADQPVTAWAGVCEFLGFEYQPGENLLSMASQQARPERQNHVYDKSKKIDWARRFSMAELDEMQQVLDLFEVSDYSMSSRMPLNDERCMG